MIVRQIFQPTLLKLQREIDQVSQDMTVTGSMDARLQYHRLVNQVLAIKAYVVNREHQIDHDSLSMVGG